MAIITGVGNAFCTGADLKTYIPQVTKLQREIASRQVEELDGYRIDDGVKAVLRGVKLYKPIIAAVNGACVAGGMEMLGGCDLRVAVPEAYFGVMEPKRGLFAGGGTTVRLPRQIPYPAAMEFLLCADRVPAEQALAFGLLNAVVPAEQLAGQGRGVRPPDHRQRSLGRAQDKGERAPGPGRRHERGVPDRVLDRHRGLLERRRQRGPGRLRGEAATALDGAVGPAWSTPPWKTPSPITSVQATPCRCCAGTAGGPPRRARWPVSTGVVTPASP